MNFSVSETVLRLPIRGVYLHVSGIRNVSSDDARVQSFVADRLRSYSASDELTSIYRGFSSLHAAVEGLEPIRSSSEALAEYFGSRGDIPRVNGLVDIYNCISLVTGFALGAHDTAGIEGMGVQLRMTSGNEQYQPLGRRSNLPISAGEYAYTDCGNNVLCRLEVRQVERTKISQETRDVFFIIQGNSNTTLSSLVECSQLLVSTTIGTLGGEVVGEWHLSDGSLCIID